MMPMDRGIDRLSSILIVFSYNSIAVAQRQAIMLANEKLCNGEQIIIINNELKKKASVPSRDFS